MREQFRTVTHKGSQPMLTPHVTHDMSGLTRRNAAIAFDKQTSRDKGSHVKPAGTNVESPDGIAQLENKFRQSRGVHLSLAKTIDRNISFIKPPSYSVHHYWHEVDWDKVHAPRGGLIPFSKSGRPTILREPTEDTAADEERWDKAAIRVRRE